MKPTPAFPSSVAQVCRLMQRLIDAAGRPTTRTALTEELARVLTDSLGIRDLEIAWPSGAPGTRIAIRVTKGVKNFRRSEREVHLRGKPLLEHLESLRHRLPRSSSSEQGASSTFVTPLIDGERELGYAVLRFPSQRKPRPLPPPRILDVIVTVLVAAVRQCLRTERVANVSRRAHNETTRLKQRLDSLGEENRLSARSPAMRTVVQQVDLVAPHDATVLMLGESGTGKELLAQRIHQRSPRKSAPFLSINCGAIPEGLVESELFGHARGAFTGATSSARGRFERAHGGTLLLDEIGELPLSAQVKLLRVLQEGEIEPLGAQKTLRVDVRVIAATHRDLATMVASGEFRSDLYYRISVFPVKVPPLRERTEDIPHLAEALLQRITERIGRLQPPSLTSEALKDLIEHPWPGNVRELANSLERAMILSRGDELDRASLNLSPPTASQPPEFPLRRGPTFQDAARTTIEDALRVCGGIIHGPHGAARRLDLKPTTLQSKIKKLGVDRSCFVNRPSHTAPLDP